MPDDEHRSRVALELNALHASTAIGDMLEGARIGSGTSVHDTNGEVLYERVPLTGHGVTGYADVAVHPAMGRVLLAISHGSDRAHGSEWNDKALFKEARAALASQAGGAEPAHDAMRLVAFCYPKLAVQFLAGQQEVAMLELKTWRPVPRRKERPRNELPTFHERSSFLDRLTGDAKARRRRRFRRRVGELRSIPDQHNIASDRIGRRQLAAHVASSPGRANQRELRFSRRTDDQHVCYEVRGQRNSNWCVPASVQMLLDFYRYEYSQDQLAAKLDLGTNSRPKELADFHAARIVDLVELMSGSNLEVTMKKDPTWADFRREIAANRPVVSFVPGHARTIAGYTETRPLPHHLGRFRGLLVYDPWPPGEGVVTRWENFDVQTYTVAFMARLRHQ